MTGVDLRPEGLYATRQMLPQVALVQADATHLPLKEDCFDVVVLLDVMEHVDDVAHLTELHEVLRSGGLLLITVPAMPWLWSYRDEAAGHLRRYTYAHLCRVLAQAQLQVQEMRYYQFWLMPLLVVMRLLGRRGPALRDLEEMPCPLLNRLMTGISRIEVQFSDWIAWPWGASLVAVCRKE